MFFVFCFLKKAHTCHIFTDRMYETRQLTSVPETLIESKDEKVYNIHTLTTVLYLYIYVYYIYTIMCIKVCEESFVKISRRPCTWFNKEQERSEDKAEALRHTPPLTPIPKPLLQVCVQFSVILFIVQ